MRELAASAAIGASLQKHVYARYMSTYSTSTNHDWFQNIFFQTFLIFFNGISKRGGTETTTTATTTTTNRFDFIILNMDVRKIP
jgi:hypothetical protein